MKHVIVTADDYGVFPSINEAVLDCAKAGRLNSVAVLANYDGDEKYFSSVENVERLKNESPATDIGCHLTITSGKPITGDKMDFVCRNGYFRSYREMPNFKEPAQLKALKEELCAQVERLQSVPGVTIKHLTNHHNSLTLFPHHFDVYMEVARLFNLPMRSAFVQPVGKQNLYMKFLNLSLRDDISAAERTEMRDFAERIGKHFADNCNGVKAPQILDSCHYGPIPQLPTLIAENILVGRKRKKLNDLYEAFRRSDKNSIELMLHLAKRDQFWNDKSRDLDYPGVDRSYFDSRVSEYKSIMGYDLKSWKEAMVKSWSEL